MFAFVALKAHEATALQGKQRHLFGNLPPRHFASAQRLTIDIADAAAGSGICPRDLCDVASVDNALNSLSPADHAMTLTESSDVVKPLPPWWGDYIGIPFVDCGFDFTGCHCWGLVRLVYLNECGIELPTYGELSANDLIAIAREIKSSKCDPWTQVVGERKAFDVQLLLARIKIDGRWVRDEGHVGVVVSPTHLLHVERSTSTVCVPLSDRSVRFRLLQTFRHKALA